MKQETRTKKFKKKGPGREKLPREEKKTKVVLFIETGKWEKLGGDDGIRKICYPRIDEEFKKQS